MEYKVGDLVQIKTAEEIRNTNIRIGWAGDMYDFCEKIFRITNIETYDGSSGQYTIYHFQNASEEMKRWLWTSDMFHPYVCLSEPEESEVRSLLF